jgi:hypothetical protein
MLISTGDHLFSLSPYSKGPADDGQMKKTIMWRVNLYTAQFALPAHFT